MKVTWFILFTCFFLIGGRGSAEPWPCFRGPTLQGISGDTNLPLTWTSSDNVAWKVPTGGEGWSSPIVWGSHVFLTATRENGSYCHLLAFDRANGQLAWDTQLFDQVPRRKQERNSYATPTPCTDGVRVYAAFGDGSFAAVHLDGAVAWTNRDFPFYGEHGLGSSPILWRDLIIMARDGSSDGPDKKVGWQTPWDQSYIVALNTRDGRLRWKSARGLSRIGHVTPNLWSGTDGRTQIISGAGDVVQGFDAATGERIWTSKNIGEGVVPSIVLGRDVAFTACGWGGRESIKAFRLGGKGDLGESNLSWEQRRGMPRIPSYIHLPPHLYTISEAGIAMCLKEENGEIVWQERVGGNFSASPISDGRRLYLLSDEGETTVLDAGGTFRVLARNALHEKCQASPAASDGHLFIRAEHNLYCLGPALPKD